MFNPENTWVKKTHLPDLVVFFNLTITCTNLMVSHLICFRSMCQKGTFNNTSYKN